MIRLLIEVGSGHIEVGSMAVAPKATATATRAGVCSHRIRDLLVLLGDGVTFVSLPVRPPVHDQGRRIRDEGSGK